MTGVEASSVISSLQPWTTQRGRGRASSADRASTQTVVLALRASLVLCRSSRGDAQRAMTLCHECRRRTCRTRTQRHAHTRRDDENKESAQKKSPQSGGATPLLRWGGPDPCYNEGPGGARRLAWSEAQPKDAVPPPRPPSSLIYIAEWTSARGWARS